MKITLSKNPKEAIGIARRAVPTHTTNEAMSCFKIVKHGDVAYVVAFDGSQAISAPLEADVVDYEKGFLVDANLFCEIINKLEVPIEIETKGNKCFITTDKAKYQLPIRHEGEFPEIPHIKSTEENTVVIKGECVKNAVKRISTFAKAPNGGNKPQFGGICISISKNKVTFAGCDGYHIGKISYDVDDSPSSETKVIVPKETLKNIANVLNDGDVTMVVGRNNLMFRCGQYSFISRKFQEDYIDYEDVFKSAAKGTPLKVDASNFYDAVNLATPIIVNAERIPLIMELSNKIKIHSVSDCGQIDTVCDISDGTVEKMRIGINSAFLFDALRGVENADEMQMYVTSPTSPIMISEGGYSAVVLPMRIR